MIKFRYFILKKQLEELSADRIRLMEEYDTKKIDRDTYFEAMTENMLIDSQTELKLTTCMNHYMISFIGWAFLIYFIVLMVTYGS